MTKFARLGDYVKIQTGKFDVNAGSPNGIYPFFTCAIEISRIDHYAFDCECVLVAGNGDLNVKYYEGKFNAYQRTYVIESKDKEKLNVRYLYYFLSLYVENLRNISIGGIIKYIKLENLTDAQIPLPKLEEQKKIVSTLDKADRLRTLRRTAHDLGESLLQSVFLEMFGDLRINEKGWDIFPLEELIRQGDTINYGVVQPGDDFPGGIPIVRVGDFYDIPNNIQNLKRIDPKIEKDYKRSRLNGDEILVACVGATLGKIALIDERFKGFNIVRATARISVGDSINRQFLAAYLKTQYVQDYFVREARTVAQPTLNIEHIEDTPILVPPLSLQEEFAGVVARVESLRGRMSEAGRQVEGLFEALLSESFG